MQPKEDDSPLKILLNTELNPVRFTEIVSILIDRLVVARDYNSL